jgi:putative phage-type endonuclease
MKRLASTIGLEKAEWLRCRKNGITGTDAGAICGMNPYISSFQVYQDKISEDIEEYDNEAMRQGRDMEEYVASRFEEETGLKVRRANAIYQNERFPFMLADFDRLITGQKAGLECKTVSPYSADKWSDEDIPVHYQMQCQHYMAVSGYECWYIAALIFSRDFIIRRIDRDEELIQNLITVEERFWNENVLKHVMPDPDGTKNCSEQIAKLYYRSDKDKTVQLLGYDNALKRRDELVALIDKLEQEKAYIDQKIQMELQDSGYGTVGDYRVSWLNTVSKRLDTKLFKAENPEMYDKYAKESSCRRFLVKRIAA